MIFAERLLDTISPADAAERGARRRRSIRRRCPPVLPIRAGGDAHADSPDTALHAMSAAMLRLFHARSGSAKRAFDAASVRAPSGAHSARYSSSADTIRRHIGRLLRSFMLFSADYARRDATPPRCRDTETLHACADYAMPAAARQRAQHEARRYPISRRVLMPTPCRWRAMPQICCVRAAAALIALAARGEQDAAMRAWRSNIASPADSSPTPIRCAGEKIRDCCVDRAASATKVHEC